MNTKNLYPDEGKVIDHRQKKKYIFVFDMFQQLFKYQQNLINSQLQENVFFKYIK